MTLLATFVSQLLRIQQTLNRVQPKIAPTQPITARPKRRYAPRRMSLDVRKAWGLCAECPEMARPGRTYCGRCAERRLRNQRKRRMAAKAIGREA